MPDFRKASRGQRLSIPAGTWNAVLENAERGTAESARLVGVPGNEPAYCPNFVLIKNDSGEDLERMNVLGINGVALDPRVSNYTLGQFMRQPVLTGVKPRVPTHNESFVVTLEPIAAGGIGRAAIGGVFLCKVKPSAEVVKYAAPIDNDVTQLERKSCGVLQILWYEGGGGGPRLAVRVM